MTNIKLYRNCEIREEKNFAVDDIERYLRDLVPVKTFDSTQYIKQGLDITVNVKLDQTYLDREWTNMYNYCRIENGGGDDNCCYYFIRDKQWISKDAIKLVLHMDVINTYKDQVKLTDKTTIQRQHKDRFEHKGDFSKVIYSWVDNYNEWQWDQRIGELVGTAKFQFDDNYVGRDVTVTIRETRQPHEIDIFEYEWDKDFAALTITAYVQGDSRPLPQAEIEISIATVPESIGNTLVRKIDMTSEGFDSVLWNQNADEVLTQEITTFDSNKDPIQEDMGENTWYLTYKTNTAYSSDTPDDFIYNNAINTFLTTDRDNITVLTNSYVEFSFEDLWDDTTQTERRNILLISFPTGAPGKLLTNSFANAGYSDAELSKTPMQFEVSILDENDNVVMSHPIYTEPAGNSPRDRLRQRCLLIGEFTSQPNYGDPKVIIPGVAWVDLKRDNYLKDLGFASYAWDTAPRHKFDLTGKLNYKLRINVSNLSLFKSDRDEGYWIYGLYDSYVRHGAGSVPYNASFVTSETLKNFKYTNRSDQQLVKIINIPYLPISLSANDMVYDTPSSQLKIDGVQYKYDPKFSNTIKLLINPEDETIPSYSPITDLVLDNVHPDTDNLRNDTYESKLYHSDFYQVKLVYDSFSYIFRNELLNPDSIKDNTNITDEYMYVDYCVSNSVASAFGLNFSSSYPLKVGYQDYNIMLVNRNLEMPIYNNYYMNYLRSGQLATDRKNKEAQQVATGIGTGIGIAQTAAGIIASATGYGATFGAPLIISGVATTATSLTGAITNSVQADRALQQKLEQAKNQAASVQGSDDIGLLKWYSHNNLCKLVKYEVSSTTKERLADLFYYCGYKCDYQDVPDTGSRYWFNFVQCNPVYDEDNTTAKMNKSCLDELSNKYQQGITFLHGHYNAQDDETEYDFKQVKENWETWLIA